MVFHVRNHCVATWEKNIGSSKYQNETQVDQRYLNFLKSTRRKQKSCPPPFLFDSASLFFIITKEKRIKVIIESVDKFNHHRIKNFAWQREKKDNKIT